MNLQYLAMKMIYETKLFGHAELDDETLQKTWIKDAEHYRCSDKIQELAIQQELAAVPLNEIKNIFNKLLIQLNEIG